VIAWLYVDRRRRERLRTRFGPEYERTVHDTGDARKAESLLERREKRVSRYAIRALTAEEHRHFSDAWRRVQALFVDDPAAAVSQGDILVTELMTARGYPMSVRAVLSQFFDASRADLRAAANCALISSVRPARVRIA